MPRLGRVAVTLELGVAATVALAALVLLTGPLRVIVAVTAGLAYIVALEIIVWRLSAPPSR